LGEKHNYHKNREALVEAAIRRKVDGPAISAKRNYECVSIPHKAMLGKGITHSHVTQPLKRWQENSNT